MSESLERPVRDIDASAIKGLAHPLRVAIYDILSKFGPQTATTLAKRLGESSGATSYHLRQLARHNFIREVEKPRSGREKWWERIPGAVSVPRKSRESDPSTDTAASFVLREWSRSGRRALEDFIDAYADEGRLDSAWSEVSDVSTSNLRLTPEQLDEIVRRYHEVTQTFIDEFRGRDDPGSRPVQIQFNAFPLIDGEETPS